MPRRTVRPHRNRFPLQSTNRRLLIAIFVSPTFACTVGTRRLLLWEAFLQPCKPSLARVG
jgi:hypothetical protein